MGVFPNLLEALLKDYGTGNLFELMTGDSGFTSLGNATLVHETGKGYVLALKDNQPELFREAQRLLLPKTLEEPEAQEDWERVKGRRIRRVLYRTEAIAGYHGWTHLTQAWLVRTQELTQEGSLKTVEDRYFVTNLRPGRLSPKQILRVVRGHWGIENDCNWALDVIHKEDATTLCTQGTAPLALGILRLLAYNLQQMLRRRTLCRWPQGSVSAPQPTYPSWREVLEALRDVLCAPKEPALSVR